MEGDRMGLNKIDRLASSIHRSAGTILRSKLPGKHITVTDVDVAPDAAAAVIWVVILTNGSVAETFTLAQKETGRIRALVARSTRVRRVPRLILKLDDRSRRAQDISQKLSGL